MMMKWKNGMGHKDMETTDTLSGELQYYQSFINIVTSEWKKESPEKVISNSAKDFGSEYNFMTP